MSFTVIIENQIRSHTGLVLWQWRGKGRGLGGSNTYRLSVQLSALAKGGREKCQQRGEERRGGERPGVQKQN